MSITLDHKQIMQMLPHSYPFLLVDRVVECIPGESIVALKNVTLNEPFFVGHFRDNPVMPGVLIIESMAQSSMLCIQSSVHTTQDPEETEVTPEAGRQVYFMSIDSAKFRRVVAPGDTLTIKSAVIHRRGTGCRFQCYAYVENELASEAQILAMIR
ncbi:3-hydroxyacyl-ACP dehydratase FabZ [Anaplasma capra]|uniref:3-hydroxyacyl-ACP dehydratase FabZ n=1 Tax=Anaplasma capra TaxID=1562740 RepID=UPI0021D5DCAB|nr:3-hydroxyacyl-ACP dehydratase FabZ [Anaplasma capra]MCU7611272.1 3-hydroxyacyl-ACP dehydratase FabZ [Anaplasma capra]MCU7612701.1 3-hydroxyacyl-ACP dehydratase FabZ [Anaplasma capra]